MQRDGKRKWFVMQPAAEPAASEQTPVLDVYTVLRDHLKYVELIHTELRHARHNRQELEMKVSELSGKVDELISVAKDLKGRVDAGSSNTSPGAPVFNPPTEDDPEVEALAHRIEDAISVLKGEKHADSGQLPGTPPADVTVPPPNVFPDPNAPAADPNAPV